MRTLCFWLRRNVKILVCLIISFLFLSKDVYSQPQPTDTSKLKERVQNISREAIQTAAAGQFSTADKMLKKALINIEGKKALNPYRAYLSFTLGYLYDTYCTDTLIECLDIAVSHYQKALNFQPNDEAALNNLILIFQRINEYDSALLLVNKIIREHPEKESMYEVMRGDIYVGMGEIKSALKSYLQAVNAKDAQMIAGEKLVDLYDNFPPSELPQLYKISLEFESKGYLSLARKGYEKLLARDPEGNSSEDVLLRWMSMVIQLGSVRAGMMEESNMDTIRNKSIRTLTDLTSSDDLIDYHITKNLEQDIWQGEKRKFYFLAFVKALADYETQDGTPAIAIHLYEETLQQLWLGFEDYSKEIYGREDALMIDLIIALSQIYNNPVFGDEGKWKQLESHIIQEKGEAYRNNNLVNRQKFHTILGQVYLERGEYKGTGFRNAEFQLTNAIKVSQERAKEDATTYSPIPHLYQLEGTLYDSLYRREPSNSNRDRLKAFAAESYANAALGYLESDNLSSTNYMIENAINRQSANSTNSPKLLAIKTIYEARSKIPAMEISQFTNYEHSILGNQGFLWLREPAMESVLPKDIVERQRFKVYSDLSAKAHEVRAYDASTKLATDARNKQKNVKVMTTRQDATRIRTIDEDPDKNPKAKEYIFSTYSDKGNEKQNLIKSQKTNLKANQ